jgi:hypothetical protein
MSFRAVVCLFGFLLALPSIAHPQLQITASEQTGIKPYEATHGGSIDDINMMNGNLTVAIPLFSLPQLGALSLSFSIVVNNNGWVLNTSEIGPQGGREFWSRSLSPLGASIVLDQDIWPISTQVNKIQFNNRGTQEADYEANGFYVMDSTGGLHPLAFDATNLSQLRSTDAAGYLYQPTEARPFDPSVSSSVSAELDGTFNVVYSREPGILYAPNGIQYQFTASAPQFAHGADQEVISDRDNNRISITPNAWASGNTTSLTDSVNRVLTSPTFTTSTQGCPSVAGQNQSLVGSASWRVPGANDTTQTYLLCYVDITINTDFGFPHSQQGPNCNSPCYTNDQASGVYRVLESIVLPNKTFWQFVYDSAPAGSTTTAYGD